MLNRLDAHSFHVPVMGIGFTIDSPIKLAFFGISSSISMVDDILMEKMRQFYSEKFDIPYHEITNKIKDLRAERITAWLNLVDSVVREKFEKVLESVKKKGTEIEEFIDMLPEFSELKEKAWQILESNKNIQDIQNWFRENFQPGSIDVNIMTKLDKENYFENEQLPPEFNDAHAALRGFANSNLESSIILSAGLNPRLYSYMEQFEDFYPDNDGRMKKKIILKTSDYRSALIQGKFLAKKGLWVSEFRVESGLNCGGHAFGADGHLMGPILEEFRQNKKSLINSIYELYSIALRDKGRPSPDSIPEVKFTAQGGVGTAEEHQFLLDYYELDSIGWGTPFLLVPEATNVDNETLKLLCAAKEEDLYLSDVSPLGVPFNNLRTNTKALEKRIRIAKGKPGSPCPKKYASLSKEFTERSICTASRQYQSLKIQELNGKDLDPSDYSREYKKIVEKACLCVGLGTSALLVNKLDTKTEGPGVSVCPGPNMAYFTQAVSLKRMVDHIYGRDNIIKRNDRPHMFIKELEINMEYLKQMIEKAPKPLADNLMKKFTIYSENLLAGINYYRELFHKLHSYFTNTREVIIRQLNVYENKIEKIMAESLVMETAGRI